MITVYRERLVPSTPHDFTFPSNVVEVTVINMSEAWDAYVAINAQAEIDGVNSILLPAGTGRSFRMELAQNFNVPVISAVSVVSEGNPLIQVDGTR